MAQASSVERVLKSVLTDPGTLRVELALEAASEEGDVWTVMLTHEIAVDSVSFSGFTLYDAGKDARDWLANRAVRAEGEPVDQSTPTAPEFERIEIRDTPTSHTMHALVAASLDGDKQGAQECLEGMSDEERDRVIGLAAWIHEITEAGDPVPVATPDSAAIDDVLGEINALLYAYMEKEVTGKYALNKIKDITDVLHPTHV